MPNPDIAPALDALMSTLPDAQETRAPSLVRVYPRLLRLAGAALFIASRTSVFVILVLLVLGIGGEMTPPRLVRLLICWVILPAGALVLLRLLFAARLDIIGDRVTLHRNGLMHHGPDGPLTVAPGSSIIPWRLPFPAPGLSLLSADVRRSFAIETWAPGRLAQQLVAAGGLARETPLARATMVFAEARDAAGRMRWPHYVLKFVIFPLLPAFIFFRLHQWIMYGGFLGQYYLHGLQAWLSTFAFHWIMSSTYLLLYAGFWRGPAELVAYLAAAFAPGRALQLRRWVERVLAVVYYGGVPLLVAARFLL